MRSYDIDEQECLPMKSDTLRRASDDPGTPTESLQVLAERCERDVLNSYFQEA